MDSLMFEYPYYYISTPAQPGRNETTCCVSPCKITYANGQYYLVAQMNSYFFKGVSEGIFYFALKKM